jgi:hypothetical protein
VTIRLPKWLGRFLGASLELGPVLILAEDDPRTIRHEAVHKAEQDAVGWVRWDWHWLTSKEFRLGAEARAWVAEGDPQGLEAFAASLASWRYLWAAKNQAAAVAALLEAWDEQVRKDGHEGEPGGSAAPGADPKRRIEPSSVP